MADKSKLRVLIAGGGTGGHVIPALAIGRELAARYGAELCYVGTERGMEARLVPEAGFRLEKIPVGPLKNVSVVTRVRTLAALPLGVARCVRLLWEFKPHAVVGVGGYASGPAMMAAILMRVPTLAYEPNAAPGLANRLIGKYVTAAAVSFPECTCCFRNAEVTGVPVREEIFAVPTRSEGVPPRLLVFAGSQGARVFNEMLPRIVRGLLEAVPGLTIVHQSGVRHEQETRAAYAASGADPARWTVSAFLTDMKEQYTAADLVLCRSGSSVAELAAAGRPSLLVPYPFAADDHQRKNAVAMAAAGAAVVRLEAGLTAEELQQELLGLLHDGARLRAMGAAARAVAKPGAVRRMAEMVEGMAKKR